VSIFETETKHRADAITLTTLEFDVLWEHLGCGRMPLILTMPSPGKTYTERSYIAARAWEALVSKGLASRPNSPNNNIQDLLNLLYMPEREVDARLSIGYPVRAIATAKGHNGVIATLVNDQVRLAFADPNELPSAIASLLPPLQPGKGHSINTPSSELDTAAKRADTLSEFANELINQGIIPTDAHTLASMATGAGHQGQFGAAARDISGQRRRADHVVGFFDTPQGRYLQLRRAGHDGTEWTTITPATHQLLVQQINDLLNKVTD